MGKAIKAAKEIAEKHEAAVQELRNKAGDKVKHGLHGLQSLVCRFRASGAILVSLYSFWWPDPVVLTCLEYALSHGHLEAVT